MTHAHRSRRAPRGSLYADITAQIVAQLEEGRLPWVQPWGRSGEGVPLGMPANGATARRYSGINVLILWEAVIAGGYPAQRWLTFKQALALGGAVRKGERGTTIFYADRFTPEKERSRAEQSGEDPRSIAFLKRFTVFNVAQCDGLPEGLAAPPAPVANHLIMPAVEAIISRSGADFRIGGERAFYMPVHDFVQVPPPSAYFEPINWHRTALHELGHWTGAKHRLARDHGGGFGSAAYAFEELIAELTAAFSCAALGIVPIVRHADYIGSWLEVLKGDDRAIFRAASAASKAADLLLTFQVEPEQEHEVAVDASPQHAEPAAAA